MVKRKAKPAGKGSRFGLRDPRRWVVALMLSLVMVRLARATECIENPCQTIAATSESYGDDGGTPWSQTSITMENGDVWEIRINAIYGNIYRVRYNGTTVYTTSGGSSSYPGCICHIIQETYGAPGQGCGPFPSGTCPASCPEPCDDDGGGGTGGEDPPGPCDDKGGDGDEDGCCADVDFDDADPEICNRCDGRGGDGDEDGCCADVDVDDGNPERCEPCDDHGGDEDEDGCCADKDDDDSNPEVGCCKEAGGDADRDGCCDDLDPDPADPESVGCGECELRGGDADRDGCCDDDDSDPEDPEKGCEKCECELNLTDRFEDWKEKLEKWFPNPADAEEQAGGGRVGDNDVTSIDFEVPFPSEEGHIDFTFDLNVLNGPFGQAMTPFLVYVRAIVLAQCGIAVGMGLVGLVRFL